MQRPKGGGVVRRIVRVGGAKATSTFATSVRISSASAARSRAKREAPRSLSMTASTPVEAGVSRDDGDAATTGADDDGPASTSALMVPSSSMAAGLRGRDDPAPAPPSGGSASRAARPADVPPARRSAGRRTSSG